jgi:hypothetical protein
MKRIHYYAILAIAGLSFIACSNDIDTETPVLGDEYVYIPDANFEKELVLQGHDSDSIVNQKILRSAAETVKKYLFMILVLIV